MRYLAAAGLMALALGLATVEDWLQNIKVPAFFHPPKLTTKAVQGQVIVHLNPLKLEVSGDAAVTKIDEHSVRLTSRSGQLAIALAPEEAIYGMTERIVADRERSETHPQAIGGLDRRGEVVLMWITPSEAVYAPFYISTRGYGMFVEGADPGVFDLGKTDPNVLQVGWYPQKGFSCVFLDGPLPTDVLERYTAMTGRPILPPPWVFQPWKWRDEHRAKIFADLDGLKINADVAEDVLMYEKLGFPKGVYLLDRPWGEGNYGYGNYEWDQDRFPNGDAMIKKMKARGWRVITWGGPWALGHQEWEFGYEARKKGLMIGDRNLDYTNPATVAWQKEKIIAFMKRAGTDGWKLDRADEYNPSGMNDIYFDGRPGFYVHNDYPRLYVKTFSDAAREVLGDDFIIKARPAYTGTTQYGITYGGDIPGAVHTGLGLVPTDKGLRSAIIGLLRNACMGYPVWGTDTGGYEGFIKRELFARWLAFSAFCPLMEIGGVDEHEPWAMPGEPKYDQEMIKIYYRFTWLHSRLADYSHGLAQRAHETGNPIVHPLIFDWPNDAKLKNVWDEYMYGPAFLVAPIWEDGQMGRQVYLPQGQWINLWDQTQTYDGPTTITVQVPLNQIAVFIKADQANLVPAELLKGL